MAVIATKEMTPTVGAEVLEVDRDRLLHDKALPDAILAALEEHGVLLFREIGVDDEEQVAFGRRLGELVARPGHPVPEITAITQDPGNHLAEYLRGNLQWHIDGAMDEIPCKAGILSGRVIAPGDGDIPLERLLTMVLDAGFEGSFDLEVMGPRVEEEGYHSSVRRSVERASELLERVGA